MNAVGYFLHAEGEAKQVQFVERNNVVIENEHKTAIYIINQKITKQIPTFSLRSRYIETPSRGRDKRTPLRLFRFALSLLCSRRFAPLFATTVAQFVLKKGVSKTGG